MKKTKTYYHITSIDNTSSILKDGLKCNKVNGEIYLFDHIKQAKNIAVNQLGISEYSLLSISSEGFKSKLIQDDVADAGSNHQWLLNQDCISPEHIEHISDNHFNIYDLIEEIEYPKMKALGISDKDYISMISNLKGRIERYNEVNGTNHPYTGN
ncbi:hypothetical protein [Leeuwenhoekiella sp. NPDC079379]|uniref:hypothetical protein n=1 Tax=Leeuwenhoekiella sp. NPDC079379 TaxID=3364122 RepID=UPI0037CA2834